MSLTQQTRDQQGRNQVATNQATDLVARVMSQRTEIAKALGDRIGPDRFLRALATDIRTTEHLDECTTDSVLAGLYVAAQLGLEIGGPRGLVYLVPYKNKNKGNRYEASLQIGYKGWVELFYRAGARSVQWFLVREDDVFRIGSDAVHGKIYTWEQGDPNSTARVTGAVAQVVTKTGGIVWEYMSRAEIEKRAKDTPFWRNWWNEQALKTVLRRLAKTAPASTELALAQTVDDEVAPQSAIPIAGNVEVRAPRQRSALAATPQPGPAPTPAPAPRPPQPRDDDAPPAEEQPVPERDVDRDGQADWEEQQRLEAEAYFEEQARAAEQEAQS